MKNRIYGSLTVLILSINLLLGCQISTAVSNNTFQNSSDKKSNNRQLVDKFEMINELVQELKESIKAFNDDLKLVAKENKNQYNVNSKNIREKINNLERQLNLLIQNSPLSENTKIASTFDNLDSTVQEIDKIIAPLEKGLTESGVRKIQKDLGFFSRRKVSEQFYGRFGETTQKEIEVFTTKKSNDLDTEISQLQQLIGKQPVVNTNIVSINTSQPDNSPTTGTNIQENNSGSEVEVAEIKSGLNKLIITVTIGGLILLIGVIFCIYRIITLIENKRRNASLIKNNQKFIDNDNFQIELNEIYKYINNIDERLKQLENNIQNHDLRNYSSLSNNITTVQQNKDVVYPQKTVISYSSPSASISNSNNQLVSIYNIDSRSLSHKTTTVSESEYTAEQRRLGRSIAPILELDNRGNYWILKESNDEYLVPKGSIKINEHNYRTISTFFECLGYSSDSHNNFTLVKPAKVSSIGKQWELIEIGQLQF